MKKIFLLATAALLMSAVAFSNDGDKNKKKGDKAKTEKKCPKPCPTPCPPCCDKDKCDKS